MRRRLRIHAADHHRATIAPAAACALPASDTLVRETRLHRRTIQRLQRESSLIKAKHLPSRSLPEASRRHPTQSGSGQTLPIGSTKSWPSVGRPRRGGYHIATPTPPKGWQMEGGWGNHPGPPKVTQLRHGEGDTATSPNLNPKNPARDPAAARATRYRIKTGQNAWNRTGSSVLAVRARRQRTEGEGPSRNTERITEAQRRSTPILANAASWYFQARLSRPGQPRRHDYKTFPTGSSSVKGCGC